MMCLITVGCSLYVGAVLSGLLSVDPTDGSFSQIDSTVMYMLAVDRLRDIIYYTTGGSRSVGKLEKPGGIGSAQTIYPASGHTEAIAVDSHSELLFVSVRFKGLVKMDTNGNSDTYITSDSNHKSWGITLHTGSQ